MAKIRPSFIDSPNFVMETDNWHLTEDATDEEIEEFKEWMSEKDIIFAQKRKA